MARCTKLHRNLQVPLTLPWCFRPVAALAVDKSSDDGANCDDGVNAGDCSRLNWMAKKNWLLYIDTLNIRWNSTLSEWPMVQRYSNKMHSLFDPHRWLSPHPQHIYFLVPKTKKQYTYERCVCVWTFTETLPSLTFTSIKTVWRYHFRKPLKCWLVLS